MSEHPMPHRWISSVSYRDVDELMSVSSKLHGIVEERLPKDLNPENLIGYFMTPLIATFNTAQAYGSCISIENYH